MPIAPDSWVELVLALAHPSQPDWVALEHHGRQVTISQLAAAMLRAAGALAGDDGVVAVSEPDPIEHTIAVLGALAAGRTAMLVDAKHPDELFADVVGRAGATATVGRAVASVRCLTSPELLNGNPVAPVSRAPAAIGSILLTSGSTGRPKLVLRSRGADLHAAGCLRIGGFPIGLGDRFLLCVTHTGAPFLTLVMGSLFARATVVFDAFAREGVHETLARHRITCTYLVPTMLRLAGAQDGFTSPGWRRLRSLLTGGERLDEPTAAALVEHLTSRVYCSYGATEIVNLTQAASAEIAQRPGTVGQANPLRYVQIVEPGTEDLVPVGEEGEVLGSGAGLYSGYLGEAEIPDWYRTGDLGRMDADGYLYITGRLTSVVQVGGNRVSTDAIAAVLRTHAAVAEAAVVAVEDAIWTTRLEGFVVLRTGETVDSKMLRNWLSQRLAPYELPRDIRIVDELKVDSSGKLSLQALRAAVRQEF